MVALRCMGRGVRRRPFQSIPLLAALAALVLLPVLGLVAQAQPPGRMDPPADEIGSLPGPEAEPESPANPGPGVEQSPMGPPRRPLARGRGRGPRADWQARGTIPGPPRGPHAKGPGWGPQRGPGPGWQWPGWARGPESGDGRPEAAPGPQAEGPGRGPDRGPDGPPSGSETPEMDSDET